MSRTAFFELLVTDVTLNALGINRDTVFHNWTLEQRPTDSTPFIVLQWGGNDRILWQSHRPAEQLKLWVHWPVEFSNDHTKLNAILDAIDAATKQMHDTPGSDGYTLSFVDIGGRSGDFLDDGFNTISKNATYELHQRRTVDA